MNLKYIFLGLAILNVVIGLVVMFTAHETTTGAMIEGVCKGLGGVFFILFYIFMLLGKQPLDKESGH
jgi:hypothetical protein